MSKYKRWRPTYAQAWSADTPVAYNPIGVKPGMMFMSVADAERSIREHMNLWGQQALDTYLAKFRNGGDVSGMQWLQHGVLPSLQRCPHDPKHVNAWDCDAYVRMDLLHA